ncbi:MAG TPA: hypothetical protein VMI31_05145 [Fimbriimonadaceae bacterium]|nr:hypothetical protein [Fimbriimonadaceae bacterium]
MIRFPRLWLGFVAISALGPLTVSCGGGSRPTQPDPTAALSHELELDREDGLPIEPNGLRPKTPVPAGQNAATLYAGVFPHVRELFKTHETFEAEWGHLSKGATTAAEREDLEAVLASQQGIIDQLVTASKIPTCDFGFAYENGLATLYPQFADSKKAVKLLCADAHLEAEAGRTARAYDLMAAADALGRQVGQTPTLIAALVEIAIDQICLKEFSHVLDLSRSQALLEKARQTLDGFSPLASLRNSFRGEFVLGLVSLKKVKSFADVGKLPPGMTTVPIAEISKMPSPLPDSVQKDMQIKYIQTWRKIMEATPADPAQWQEASKALRSINDAILADRSVENLMTQIMVCPLGDAADAIGREQASRNLAATAIQLIEIRLKTGSYPASLPAGPTSLDPFDGQPLRYRRKGSGFTIYSIDRNLKDDGGGRGDLALAFR